MADTMVRPALAPREDRPKRFTRQEFLDIMESGALQGRYELIDGEIIEKMGYGWVHAHIIIRLTKLLAVFFDIECLRGQMPVIPTGPGSEYDGPQPDMVVTERTATARRGHPDAADVLLLIEVADSSLATDLGKKALRYAVAGVRDYWVVDVNARRLHVLRDPGPDGYRSVTAYGEAEVVSLLLRPGAALRLADLLPAPDAAPDA